MRDADHDALMPNDKTGAEERAREANVRSTHIRFLVAAVLTVPLAALAMGGHFVPSLAGILIFPGRA